MVEDDGPYPKDILMGNPEAMYKIILGLDKRVKDLEKKLREKSSVNSMEIATKKRGGSDKGKTGITWSWETEVVTKHNYVDCCANCKLDAPKKNQKISFSKRVLEMNKPLQLSLYEIHTYSFNCPECKMITQGRVPTIQGTSLGPKFLAFIAARRYETGRSYAAMSMTIAEITGVKISQTSLNRGIKKVCGILEEISEGIIKEIMNADKVYMKIPSDKSKRKKTSFHCILTDLNSICIILKHPNQETAMSAMVAYSEIDHCEISENLPEEVDHILDDVRLYTVGRTTFKNQSTKEIYGVLLTVLTTWKMQGIDIEENLSKILQNYLNSKIIKQ